MNPDMRDPIQAQMGGVLVLRDNDWRECTIDHLQGDWQRMTRQSPRGFCSVNAGRHQVVTMCGDEPVVLDLVLYPGETLVRRLDSQARQWVLDDPETERNYMQLAQGGMLGAMSSALISFSRVMLAAKGGPAELMPQEVGRAVCDVFQRAADQVAADAPPGPAIQAAYEAGMRLVGLTILYDDLKKMVAFFQATASRHAISGDLKKAAQATLIGLSILPGEPWLLDLLANLYSDGGMPDRAMPCIDEALRRAYVYPPEIGEQMQRTLAEVKAALGQR
jgi:hypothetical protein